MSFSNEIRDLPDPTSFLIIGKAMFSRRLQAFAKHKNEMGISTRFVNLESILHHRSGDAPSLDDPSKVKHALNYAYQHKSTRYVMLVGDASLFPVRHRYVSAGNEFGRPKDSTNDWWMDGTYIPTDHYYASLFHHSSRGNNYDDWNQNKNSMYNEEVWNWNNNPKHTPVTYNPDKVDGYPDLVVARLPIHNGSDLKIYVDKAIKYDNGEMSPYTKNGITLIADGGYETSDDMCDQLLKYKSIKDRIGADRIIKLALNFPENGRSVKPGWDEGTFVSIRSSVSKTWGLLYLGHGNTGAWGITEGSKQFNKDEVNKFIGPLSLPVVLAIGCETGLFKPDVPGSTGFAGIQYLDVNNQKTWYLQFDHDTIWKSTPANLDKPDPNQPLQDLPTVIDPPGPYDLQDQSGRTFAYPWLFQKNEGGGIAYFGETVVCQNDLGRDLIARVLSAYYNNKKRDILLGDIWILGQQQFWKDYKNNGDVFRNPRIYLSIMTFFGDPTLKLPPPALGSIFKIADNWHNLPAGFEGGFDAAVNGHGSLGGKCYFFKGDSYVRYSWSDDKADAGYPRKIAENWHKLPAGFKGDFDAAVSGRGSFGGKCYFFKGDSYIRYDWHKDKVDPGYPRKVVDNWHNLPAGFEGDFDAIMNGGGPFDGKCYFFKGDSYIRYDWHKDKVDPGYPRKVVDNWHNLPAGFEGDFDAALEGRKQFSGKGYFFKNDYYVRYNWKHDYAEH